MFQGSFKVVSRLGQESFKKIEDCFDEALWVFQGSFKSFSKEFQGVFKDIEKGVLRKLQICF